LGLHLFRPLGPPAGGRRDRGPDLREQRLQELLQLLAQPGIEADAVDVAPAVALGRGQRRQGGAEQRLGLGLSARHEARSRRILDIQGFGAHARQLRLISSRSSFPALKWGTFLAGTSTPAPVLGLRPVRLSRRRTRKLPKPRSSIFSPLCRASMIEVKTASTMTSECFRVRSETLDTASTSSALVMRPGYSSSSPF